MLGDKNLCTSCGCDKLPEPSCVKVCGKACSVQTTVIPQQVLTTEKHTCLKGHQENEHCSDNCRFDTFGYMVDGHLQSVAVDCNQEAECDNDSFRECGLGCVTYDNKAEGGCRRGCNSGCNDNSDCEGFEDSFEDLNGGDNAMEKFTKVDPEKDVENRINHHIRKTISDVLSQIVEKAICGSLQHTISIDDGGFADE